MGKKFGYILCPKMLSLKICLIFPKMSETFYSEKLHLYYCKYILGVHKKSSNFTLFEKHFFRSDCVEMLTATSVSHRVMNWPDIRFIH